MYKNNQRISTNKNNEISDLKIATLEKENRLLTQKVGCIFSSSILKKKLGF